MLTRHRDLRVVIPARTLCVLGDQITLVVLLLRVSATGEPRHATVLLVAFALPLVALAPLAGRIVDGYDSRVVLIGAGTVQVVASTGLMLAPGFEATIGAVLVLRAGQAVSQPAWSALLPSIVGDDEIGDVVGLSQSLYAAAGLAGSALGGVLYASIGYRHTLLADTLTFVALTVAGALVRTRRGGRHDHARARARRDGESASAEGGWRYIRDDALLRLLVPALCLLVLFAEATGVVEVFLVRDAMGASAWMFGVASATLLLGTIGGPLLARRFRDDAARIRAAGLCTAVAGVLTAATGLAPTVWYALPLMLGMGFAFGGLNAVLATIMLARPPEHLRGRVMATLNGALRGGTVLALALGGLGGQLLGPRATYVVCGLLTAAVAGLILRSRRGLSQRALSSHQNPSPTTKESGFVRL